MPVTAKLSLRFYEKLGEEVANELVEWFNSVDATYRSDLRELNELNFARFDAKLEQHVAQLDAKLEQRVAQLGARIEQGLAELRAEFRAELRAELSGGLTSLESRLVRQIGELRSDMERGFALADGRFSSLEGKLIGRLDTRIADVRTEMLRWMLAAWASMMLVLMGTLFAVLRTR